MTLTANTRAAGLNGSGQFVCVTCPNCGIHFQIPQLLEAARRADEAPFYCPLGHSQYFPAGRTQDEIDRERIQELERVAANLTDDLNVERLAHRSTKTKLTKLQKRAANGVCPCCSRSFVNVARHVKHMHPEFGGEVQS